MADSIMLKREDMMNAELLPIKTILFNLEIVTYRVHADESFSDEIKNELVNCGYQGQFAHPSTSSAEHVMHVLSTAVNEAVTKKLDLKQTEEIDVIYQQFPELLQKTRRNEQELLSATQLMTSPLNMTQFVDRRAPQWSVANLFDHQFDVIWNTETEKPNDYTFYEFCNTKNTSNFFKYKPRLAHVKATLFKECSKKRELVDEILKKQRVHLCPPVYIRTVDGWKSRHPDSGFNDADWNELSWIDPSFREFITENADEQKSDDASLKNSLTKPTLYWAVMQDKDFMSGEVLKLKEIGATQVYVGKANNGIKGRWLSSGNHCEMMMKCLKNVHAMTTYDAMRLDEIHLVDARLALATVRGESTALFVMKTFDDDMEKAEIRQMKAKKSLTEAEESLSDVRSFDQESLTQSLKVKVAERKKELDKVNDDINDLKVRKIDNSEAKVFLENAERLHRIGKRVDQPKRNIIPYKKHDMTWRPKDMGYGMNAN